MAERKTNTTGLFDGLSRQWVNLVLTRYKAIVMGFILLAGVGGVLTSQLGINTNQLDLISKDLREVQDVKRVQDMIGGVGHIIVALRGNSPKNLEKVSDDLAAQLKTRKEDILSVTYRVSAEFLRTHGMLFMETADLKELRRRVDAKLDDAVKRASPFFFEIEETEPVELNVDDLVAKYSRIGKRTITTDYYMSDDKKMLVLLVKPTWGSQDVAKTGQLIEDIRAIIASYNQTNDADLVLVENATEELPESEGEIAFGFTGTYTHNFHDSNEIKKSITPVALLALGGILVLMLVFFRRAPLAVPLVMSGLIIGLLLTLGFTKLAFGELNMITGILAGILAGLGIDFGVHLVYRLGDELGQEKSFEEAIQTTIFQAGHACFLAAGGVAVAFASLIFSDFRGFSHLGILAGVGVVITGVVLYLWVPALLAWMESSRPGVAKRSLGRVTGELTPASRASRIPFPMMWMGLASLVVALLVPMASGIEFEYDSRALQVKNHPAMLLQDEMDRRFQISADPVALYTPDLKTAKDVFNEMTPLDEERFSTVEQVVSIYSMVPPADQQARNMDIIRTWREDLKRIDRKSLPPEMQEKWDEAMKFIEIQTYTVEDVPPHLAQMFQHNAETRPENHGVLTYIYPRVDLWDGEVLMQYAGEVGQITVGSSGETYGSAGTSILLSRLAHIVLADARFAVLWTLGAIFLLMVLAFRKAAPVVLVILPLGLGTALTLGGMALFGAKLTFMNVVVCPIILGYGLSHGVYLIARFEEGATPMEALLSVGRAVACSTLTTAAGWAALLAASHNGVKSMGSLACLGLLGTLTVALGLLPPLLQWVEDRRRGGNTPFTKGRLQRPSLPGGVG